MKKAEDQYMAMLTYSTTPLSSGFSPTTLLMSCCLRANLSVTQSQLQPSIPVFSLLKAKEEEKKNQKRVFDSRHAVHDLRPLFPDEEWVSDHNTTGHAIELIVPRSYHVSRMVRCNHAHLRCMTTSDSRGITTQNAERHNCVDQSTSRITVTKSGCISIPPK